MKVVRGFFKIIVAMAGGAVGLYVVQQAFPPEVLHGYFVRCSEISKDRYVALAHGPGEFLIDFFSTNSCPESPANCHPQKGDRNNLALGITANGLRGESEMFQICRKLNPKSRSCEDNGWEDSDGSHIDRATSELLKLESATLLRGAPVWRNVDSGELGNDVVVGMPMTIVVQKLGWLGGAPVSFPDCAFR